MKHFLLFLLLSLPAVSAEVPDRISEIKEKLSETISFPVTWKLRYRGTKDNYAIFYDISGKEVYFKYRRNKFDEDGIRKIRFLLSGVLYEIKGEFAGMYVYTEKLFPDLIKPVDVTTKMKKLQSSIPVFNLTEYRSLAAEDVIF